tara:strand:- start:1126 stop:1335 length:210 start_codon:yes stop_codon:yes gene_type:complete
MIRKYPLLKYPIVIALFALVTTVVDFLESRGNFSWLFNVIENLGLEATVVLEMALALVLYDDLKRLELV